MFAAEKGHIKKAFVYSFGRAASNVLFNLISVDSQVLPKLKNYQSKQIFAFHECM